jgi:drug/metabolite transporter (DMT)-like permease
MTSTAAASHPAARTGSPSGSSLGLLDLGSLLYLGAVWGAAFLFLRIAAPEVGPAWAAEFRLAIGAGVLVLFAGRSTLAAARGRWLAFLAVGATFSAIPFTLIAVATLTLPTGFTALLNAATPLFTAVLGVIVLGQRLLPRVVAGLAVGAVAVVVLVGGSPLEVGPTTLLAVAAGLGAPASYAVAGTLTRKHLAGIGGTELATGMLVAGAIVALPVALLTGAPGIPSVDGVVSLVAVGTLSTALAWPVFFRVLQHSTPTTASTVTFIVPAFAIAWGAIALGESVGPELIAGFAAILVSLILVLGIRPNVPAILARLHVTQGATA